MKMKHCDMPLALSNVTPKSNITKVTAVTTNGSVAEHI
jgi:hypothetical protein